MKPRKNYRSRPVKSGAVKRQRILAQKRRLVAAGYKMEDMRKMTTPEIRDLLKKIATRKFKNAVIRKAAKKKAPAAKAKTAKKA